MRIISLPCRHYRVYTDPDRPCVEQNFKYVERELSIPVEQSALVLVDVWSTHYIASWLERAGQITRARIVPALEAAREAGMLVVHAPSPMVAQRYGVESPPGSAGPGWPPAEFRRRSGPYQSFSRHDEPRLREALARYETELDIAEIARPLPGEPVIATGEQLQALLAERQILHLFYAGFATNWCVLYRDYGMVEMARRGYNLILLRDATTGVEFHDSVASEAATAMSVREIETKQGWSTTTEAFVAACRSLSMHSVSSSL
jgi:nicotinamidase-related amidase